MMVAVSRGKSLGEAVEGAVAGLDFERVRREYWEQNEFVFLERFLPPAVVAERLVPQVERLRSDVHRSYLPRFKKGGSVSAYTLSEKAPEFLELYRSPAFISFLSRLVDARLTLRPKNDPHACALYFYTEPTSMAIFNGDKLWHSITPLGNGEERVSLTLEYVTNPEMPPLKRLFSNMKDAFAYFGVRTLLRRRR